MKLISDTLKEIQHLPIEHFRVFNKRGALVFVQEGTVDTIQLYPHEFRRLRNKIIVHNHPSHSEDFDCGLSDVDKRLVDVYKAQKIISICSCGKIDLYQGGSK